MWIVHNITKKLEPNIDNQLNDDCTQFLYQFIYIYKISITLKTKTTIMKNNPYLAQSKSSPILNELQDN